MNIEELFKNYKIEFQKIDAVNAMFEESLLEEIVQYLSCMGKTIRLHETPHGSAYTTLFSVYELKREQCTICGKNELLIIGYGLNGDLLTINLKNSHVGYIFHDELCEENYDSIEDIYVELPFGIMTLLDMALAGKDYPFDGYMAENYE